jgi:hypothetical protein
MILILQWFRKGSLDLVAQEQGLERSLCQINSFGRIAVGVKLRSLNPVRVGQILDERYRPCVLKKSLT